VLLSTALTTSQTGCSSICYAATVRWALGVLASGCGFTHGAGPIDSRADALDAPPDMVVPTWNVDATSHKGVPSDLPEWMELVNAHQLSTSPPQHLWLMQEASGSLTDSIGSTSLAKLNNPTYRNADIGWTRVAVGTPETGANEGFVTYSLGNLDGTSYALLLYVAVLAAPASESELCALGANADYRYVAITPAPVFKAAGIGVTPALGTIDPKVDVHPLLVKLDETHQAYTVYSDEEKISVAWAGTAGLGNELVVGNGGAGSALARYFYGALWSGPAAEMSDADAKKLLEALGWTVTGY
jgi:hypothetical protein